MRTQKYPSVQTSKLFPQRFVWWQHQGLSARASSAVALAGCTTVADITALGREYFERLPNCAAKTLAELSLLAGWPPKRSTPVDAIAAALCLSISDPEEAREVATDALMALRRSGFAVVASRSALGGSR